MISAEVRNEWRHKTFNFFLLVVVVALVSAHAVVWSPPAVLDQDVLGIARISFSSVFFLPLATRPSFLCRVVFGTTTTKDDYTTKDVVLCGYKKNGVWKNLKKKMKNEKPKAFFSSINHSIIKNDEEGDENDVN